MYCPVLTAPNVCSYTTLAKMNFQISICLTADRPTSFISTKLFLVFKPNFDIFLCRNTPEEHVAFWHHTYYL